MRRRSAIAIAVTLLVCACASAQERRFHGQTLDENNRLLIEETEGTCRIGIFTRSRVAGDFMIDKAQTGPGISPRANPAPEYLLEVRSEVLKSSAPNYLQNPGERYRITMHTLTLEPEYSNMVEVPAEFARDQLFFEFEKVRERTTGIERTAVEAAAPLVAEIFKETNLLPAEIFTSVLKSRTGQFRITPGTRQRRQIEAPQSFAPKHDFGKPELGATKRSRQRQALPPGAAKPGEIAGPQIEENYTRPIEPGKLPVEGDKPKP